MTKLRIATRKSPLALAQAQWCADRIAASSGRSVELVDVVTEGDTNRGSLRQIGGTGVFASAVRQAVEEGRCDVAIHSAKDLPSADYPGLTIAAVPMREDSRDVLVSSEGRCVSDLPSGAKVGTGSPRRAVQLQALGLGLEIVDIRGNIDTRLSFVSEGRLDAVVLAAAGLRRLGRLDVVCETFDPLQMLPAAGQGCLAVECRSDDSEMIEVVRTAIHDEDSAAALESERSVLRVLQAGCSAPVGVYAEVTEDDDGVQLYVRAAVACTDVGLVRRSVTGPIERAQELGKELARQYLDDGLTIDMANVQSTTLAGE